MLVFFFFKQKTAYEIGSLLLDTAGISQHGRSASLKCKKLKVRHGFAQMKLAERNSQVRDPLSGPRMHRKHHRDPLGDFDQRVQYSLQAGAVVDIGRPVQSDQNVTVAERVKFAVLSQKQQ